MREIEVVKEFTFDSAHYIPRYEGKCRNIHGHTYRLQIGFKGLITETGMVIDFAYIKQAVKDLVVDKLDHAFLNELDYCSFPKEMPTAEKMVNWIVCIIQSLRLPSQLSASLRLSFVRLYETPTSYAEWREENAP